MLGLDDKRIKILCIEEDKEKNKTIKIINAISTNAKVRCSVCNKDTRSVHDYLKPINCKYNKVAEYECCLRIKRKKFICRKFNKELLKTLELSI